MNIDFYAYRVIRNLDSDVIDRNLWNVRDDIHRRNCFQYGFSDKHVAESVCRELIRARTAGFKAAL